MSQRLRDRMIESIQASLSDGYDMDPRSAIQRARQIERHMQTYRAMEDQMARLRSQAADLRTQLRIKTNTDLGIDVVMDLRQGDVRGQQLE